MAYLPMKESVVTRTLKNSAAGTVGGIGVVLTGHPFDTLKVRLQTQPVAKPVYNGLADCFIKTLKWEGFGGLYKGVGSPLVGQMFFRATLFTSYYQITELVAGSSRNGQHLKAYEYFLCGSATGFIVAFVEGPIDLFKTKMQVQIIQAKSGQSHTNYRNVFHAGYSIMQQHRLKGAYQGIIATCLRNTPANGIYFGLMEMVKHHFTPASGGAPPKWAVFVAGGTGGFFYWFLTYPTDVIKSSMMSDATELSKRKYSGYIDCAQQIYKEGGLKNFFRGFTPCLLRAIPANGVMIFLVDQCRVLLGT